jgi:hypothetical protein
MKCGQPFYLSLINWSLDNSLDVMDSDPYEWPDVDSAAKHLCSETIDEPDEGEEPAEIEGFIYMCVPVGRVVNGKIIDLAATDIERMARAAEAAGELAKAS